MQSSDAGNLYEPMFEIVPSTGLTIDGNTIDLEYPVGSGNWETFATNLTNGAYTIDAMQHTALAAVGYLKGTLEAASNGERQVNIRFNMTADCDFTSGRTFRIKVLGKNSCDNPAEGSNSGKNAPGIKINGATEPYIMNTVITWDAATPPNGSDCKSAVQVNVTETIVGSTQPTGSDGKIEVTIPAGFVYVLNSYTPAANAAPIGDLQVVILQDGSEQLKLPILPGLITGTPIEYSFDIQENPLNIPLCGTEELKVVSKEKISNLSCGTTSCSTSYAITGQETLEIEVKKADIEVSIVSAAATHTPAGENITVEYTLENTSTVDLALGTLVTLFNDEDGDHVYGTGDFLLAKEATTAAVANGSVYTATFTLTDVDPDNLCNVRITILPGDGCFCSIIPAAVTFSELEGIAGEDVEACQNGATTILGTPSTGYTYAWTSSNASGLNYLSATDVAQPVFEYTGAALAADFDIDYTLTVTRPDGCVATDHVVVTVKAGPTFTDANTEVCLNSTIGSGFRYTGGNQSVYQ